MALESTRLVTSSKMNDPISRFEVSTVENGYVVRQKFTDDDIRGEASVRSIWAFETLGSLVEWMHANMKVH